MEWLWVKILSDAAATAPAPDGVTDLVVKALSGSAAASWVLIALLFIKGWIYGKSTVDQIVKVYEARISDLTNQRDRAMGLAERGTGVAEQSVAVVKEKAP